MSSALRVQWTITPRIPPQPWLACSRCRGIKPFRCSGKFRLNANGKRLDAWLIYRCVSCDNTWNRPVLERRNRRDIDPLFLHALEANHPQWICRYAFDIASLRNRAERVEEFSDVEIEKHVLSAGSKPLSELEILLAVPVPTCLRTDRLLASQLGLSRKRVEDLTEKGREGRRGSTGAPNIHTRWNGDRPLSWSGKDGEAIAQAAAGSATEPPR